MKDLEENLISTDTSKNTTTTIFDITISIIVMVCYIINVYVMVETLKLCDDVEDLQYMFVLWGLNCHTIVFMMSLCHYNKFWSYNGPFILMFVPFVIFKVIS